MIKKYLSKFIVSILLTLILLFITHILNPGRTAMISGNEMQFSEALRAINQVELETLSALTERCVIVDLREKDDFLIAALSGNDFNNQSEDVRTFKNHDIVIICAEKNQYQKVGKISQKIQTLGRFLIYVYVE